MSDGRQQLLAQGVEAADAQRGRVHRLLLPAGRGVARLDPAIAFLYSGPAINVLAIILTARIPGPELGVARGVGAIAFSVVIGLMMALLFRQEELEKRNSKMIMPDDEPSRPRWQNAVFFGVLVAILVFANWARPDTQEGVWYAIHAVEWWVTGLFGVMLAAILIGWMKMPQTSISFTVLLHSAQPVPRTLMSFMLLLRAGSC